MIGEIYGIDLRIERSIDSILYLHFCVARLDVNVRGPRLHSVVNDRVDQLNYRGHFGIGCPPIKVKYLLPMFCFSYERDTKTGCRLLQHALRGIASAQNDFYSSRGGDIRNDASVKGAGQLIKTFKVRRVCHGNMQTPVISFERKKLMTDHQVHGNLVEQIVINRRFAIGGKKIYKG